MILRLPGAVLLATLAASRPPVLDPSPPSSPPSAALALAPPGGGVLVGYDLGLEASRILLADGALACTVGELGVDADGDGQTDGVVVFADGLSAWIGGAAVPRGHLGHGRLDMDRRRLVWSQPEEGVDANGDGDGTDEVIHLHDVDRGTTSSLGLATVRLGAHFSADPRFRTRVVGDSLYVTVLESDQGQDLNGNGSATDSVLEVLQVGSRNPLHAPAASRPPLTLARAPAVDTFSLGRAPVGQDFVVALVREAAEGRDLNGDGDTSDQVPRYQDWRTNVPTIVPFAVSNTSTDSSASDEVFAFLASELGQGSTDLNGDGDTQDRVACAFLRSTRQTTCTGLAAYAVRAVGTHVLLVRAEAGVGDLNGDGDAVDFVLEDYDAVADSLSPLGVAVEPTARALAGAGDWALLAVSEAAQGGTDLNGDGDAFDQVLHRLRLSTGVLTNLLTAVDDLSLAGGRLITVEVDEPAQGADFDLDGDALDRVLGVFDTQTGILRSTFLAVDSVERPRGAGSWVAFRVPESDQGNTDLNGDGDRHDLVLVAYDAERDLTLSSSTAVTRFAVQPGALAASVSESDQGGTDLNGDGDVRDDVLHLFLER